MKLDFARLNHVLVPPTKSERDRYRNGRAGRGLRVFVRIFTRLTREGRILAMLVCVAGVFAADVQRTEAHILVFATGSLLFASLLFATTYKLTGVAVELRSPRRVTVGEELAITVSLANRGTRAHGAIRVEQPLLPWDGRWSAPPLVVPRLGLGEQASVTIFARFVARGEHHIDPFWVVALVPLWLAQGAPLRTEGARFVVIPRVARVTSFTLDLQRRHQPGGSARASRAGEATDLLGVRPYRPGDPVRDLHARSWARHGSPMVREYQQEHMSRVALIVDSDTSGKAVRDEHLEGALSLAAGIIARLGRGEAHVAWLVAGDDVHALAGERGASSLDEALDLLAAVKPSGPFVGERVFARLGRHLEHLASVVFVALTWDAARASVASSLRARGVGCVVVVVGDAPAREPHGSTIALDAITRGDALEL